MESKQSYYLIISVIGLIYIGFIWFVSDITRAATIDRVFLYYVDDIFRYCYIKSLSFNPIIALNFSLKIGYALIAAIFYHILPIGISSLRVMNVLFSCGIFFIIYKLTQQLSLPKLYSSITIILTATFPIFFLTSLTTLSEVMYSFFIVLAIYLLCSQKVNLSFFIIAFLPLIRQEGLLYVLIWIYLLRKEIKIKYLPLLLLPTLFWIVANNIFLGHSLIKFIFYLPAKDPPNSMATLDLLLKLTHILIYHPIIMLSFIGLIITWSDIKYRILKLCFISHMIFILFLQIVHFFDSCGMFCREIRIIMPLVPIMALYSGTALARLLSNYRVKDKLFLGASFIVLSAISTVQITQLQRQPAVISDSVNKEDEYLLKNASIWLYKYIQNEDINKVCIVPGALTTDKIIRRIWMYLPGYVNFYAVGEDRSILNHIDNGSFDLAALKYINLPSGTKCIFISKEMLEKDKFSSAARVDLINMYPDLHLYFYVVVFN
jgi:hypothetical protein